MGSTTHVNADTDLLSVEEVLLCQLLQEELDPHKSVGPDAIHLRMLRELVNAVARPLP